MSEDPILTAIARLGTDLRAEMAAGFAAGRAETARLIEGVHTALDAIREDLTVLGGADAHTRRLGDNTREELRSLADLVAAIQRAQLKHGTRLDALERRLPPAGDA
jgi:hypothetical protein